MFCSSFDSNSSQWEKNSKRKSGKPRPPAFNYLLSLFLLDREAQVYPMQTIASTPAYSICDSVSGLGCSNF